ncbi:SDR family oxidoreductase [Asanoa iriomotensis]|uniref:NAD(P)-dependent oxidoreductase n=1 Tax=Asanoa iriomotensis TaxID=234613 RepID=A0ABQ4CEH2_9ACTN|nr:SDR family oxidoreductase [Asanoa iriomotensis]GIF61176.1 NAD(P)-dependent oxidoreductase [Asanoa iriomotensis]
MTILVTAANGMVSREVLRALAAADQEPVRALVREPAAVTKVAGVEYVAGDLDRPATLGPAFEGVDKLWLLTPMGAQAPAQSSDLLWAARQAEVRHVVRLSAIGAAHDAPTRNGRLHALSDGELQESGIPWTILRPTNFMQNMLGSVAGEQMFGIYGEGRVGAIDVRDIAAVGAEILLAPERHAGKIYTLTGPASVSLHEAAEEAGRALGRPVKYVPADPEGVRDFLLQLGLPEWYAAMIADYRAAYGAGWGDFTNSHVADIIGRSPRSLAEFIHDHRDQLSNDN